MNLVILFSYRKHGLDWTDHLKDPTLFDYFSTDTTYKILITLGSFLTLFLGIVVMSFLYKYILSTYYRLALEWEHREYKASSTSGGVQMIATNTMFVVDMLYRIVANWELLNNLANLSLAICGCAIHPLFFTYHFFVAAFRSKRLQAVLNAIKGPAVSILLTLILYLLMEYLFTVIGYVVFPGDFPNYSCDSLVHCLMFIIDQTYKGNNGAGASLQQVYTTYADQTVSIKYERVVFDLMFTLTIVIITVQLLSGLIIDKFRSLRDEAESREKDLLSSCMICSESAEDIERSTKESFAAHCARKHNTWFYLMFVGLLLSKPKIDFSGVESYVHESIKTDDVCWLPYSLYHRFGCNICT
ncbi:MAG: ion transporter [Candidatus Pacebacteria bacterium]|nr:ion transporter [Candidatus Paceibacterota bacterium]